jgi:hypothetical protein
VNELSCRRFLLCHTVWYDAENPEAGHSLGRVVVSIRPPEVATYPFALPWLFAYGQLHGDPGDHSLRIRLVRIEPDGYDDEQEVGVKEFGPFVLQVTGEELADAFAVAIRRVPFPAPGLYEFQLWADGTDEPLARERIQAKE